MLRRTFGYLRYVSMSCKILFVFRKSTKHEKLPTITYVISLFNYPELPPVFIKKLATPVRVTSGDSASLEIELSKGDATTKWYKDAKELDVDGDAVKLQIDGKKQRLVLSNVTKKSSGQYRYEILCYVPGLPTYQFFRRGFPIGGQLAFSSRPLC